jgi:hypothetical protein
MQQAIMRPAGIIRAMQKDGARAGVSKFLILKRACKDGARRVGSAAIKNLNGP